MGGGAIIIGGGTIIIGGAIMPGIIPGIIGGGYIVGYACVIGGSVGGGGVGGFAGATSITDIFPSIVVFQCPVHFHSGFCASHSCAFFFA